MCARTHMCIFVSTHKGRDGHRERLAEESGVWRQTARGTGPKFGRRMKEIFQRVRVCVRLDALEGKYIPRQKVLHVQDMRISWGKGFEGGACV